MRARFQIQIERGAAGFFTGLRQRDDLGVMQAGVGVKATHPPLRHRVPELPPPSDWDSPSTGLFRARSRASRMYVEVMILEYRPRQQSS
jgi:hypothetical protein